MSDGQEISDPITRALNYVPKDNPTLVQALIDHHNGIVASETINEERTAESIKGVQTQRNAAIGERANLIADGYEADEPEIIELDAEIAKDTQIIDILTKINLLNARRHIAESQARLIELRQRLGRLQREAQRQNR